MLKYSNIGVMNLFILIATVIFGLFTLIWKRDTALNLFLKAGLAAMTVYGIYLIVHD